MSADGLTRRGVRSNHTIQTIKAEIQELVTQRLEMLKKGEAVETEPSRRHPSGSEAIRSCYDHHD